MPSEVDKARIAIYTIPVSDTAAIAIDTTDSKRWDVHFLNFADYSSESFSVLGTDEVIVSARYDAKKRQIWLVIGMAVFVIIVKEQEMFNVEMPSDDFEAYDLVQIGQDWLICGANSMLWKCSPPNVCWTALMQPDPPPQRSDDPVVQTQQTQVDAVAHPPLYSAFSIGDTAYFCGALGFLVRLQDGRVDTMSLETNSRLVSGHVEGSRMVLSSDSPTAEIFVGSWEEGFERIFEDGNRAMHRTAMHLGRRFIGVAEYPPTKALNLYTLVDGELLPEKTGCAFEPSPLISLVSTGEVLWAIDAHDIYRLVESKWSLTEGDAIREGTWLDGK